MEELFHKLTNFREQSLKPSTHIYKRSSHPIIGLCLLFILFTGWIGHYSVLQYCSIISFLFAKIWEYDLYFAPPLPRGSDRFCGRGKRGTPPSPKGGAGNPPFPRGGAPIPASSCSECHIFNSDPARAMLMLGTFSREKKGFFPFLSGQCPKEIIFFSGEPPLYTLTKVLKIIDEIFEISDLFKEKIGSI